MSGFNWVFVLAGLAGGMLRGLVGIAKSKSVGESQFIPMYLGVTLGVSALVGLVAGVLADRTWEISFFVVFPLSSKRKVATFLFYTFSFATSFAIFHFF